MRYSPNNRADRRALAQSIRRTLSANNFTVEPTPNFKEEVWSLAINYGIRVVVYTTIENGCVRIAGSDAIRVIAIYRNKEGQDRWIASSEKIVRSGEIEGIVQRMHLRIQEIQALGNNVERCAYCNAPKFVSKAGNLVCADLCWKKSLYYREHHT